MFIARTLIGLEKICIKEVNGKKVIPGRIKFDKKFDIVKSALEIYEYVNHFKFKDLEDLKSKVKLNLKGSFRVDCNREGEHKFGSQDVRREVGELLFNENLKVDLKNPETIVYIDIKDKYCFIGLNPVNCVKRSYRLRSSRNSLNASIAYSLLKIADYKKGDLLLDPFCGDGVILIEAGLLGGKKLYGFEDYIFNAKANSFAAKIKLELHNEELDWLGTLFKENSVDKIITQLEINKKEQIKEMFKISESILKKEGCITVISSKIDNILEIAKNYKFNNKKELEVNIGDIKYEIYLFEKAI